MTKQAKLLSATILHIPYITYHMLHTIYILYYTYHLQTIPLVDLLNPRTANSPIEYQLRKTQGALEAPKRHICHFHGQIH